MESAAGPSKQHTQCGVYGCAVSSLNHPDSSFFAVPTDPTRSEQWLKLIHREDLVGSNQVVFVCYRHFNDHEIISTPFRNLLRKDVAPSMNLPGYGTRDRFVQVQPWQFDEYVQTDFKDPFQHLIGRKSVSSQIGPTLVTELRRRRALLDDYESHMKQLKEFEGGSDSAHAKIFFAACDHFLSPRLAELVKARVNVEGKKHTLEYKVFCLNLYHMSPRAYALISEDFDLPSISKLKQINIPLTSAINEAIMDAFKIKVNNMTETEKYCSVAVDVMSIKSRLFYSAKQDRIIGFHEIDGVQTPIPAHFAVVLVLKGIYGNWTQPIGYALLSEEKCHQDVSKWIDKILSKLLDIGLKVKTLVCTAKSKLLNESKMRLVSVDQPFFVINGERIYYIYDIPYMFRQVRNFFLTHDFHYEKNESKCVAKFSDVEEFYEHDKKRSLPIANRLTNYHLHPSMQEKRNTKFAAELLSKKVAMGMETYIDFNLMHEYARDTVYFIDLVNNLYEVLNSSVISPKTYHGKKRETKLLKNAILFLKTLKLINTDTDIDNTKKATFIKGLQITIQSIILLFEELKKDSFKYLLVGRLNLTVTENLFKRIKARGKLTVKPTSQRFSLMYRKLFFGYFLKGTHQAGTEEFGKLIAQIHELSESMNSPDNYGINPSDSLTQTQLKDLQEVAKFAEGIDSFRFCGILLRKCVEYHKDCDVLKYFVNAYEITHGLRATSDEVLPVKPEPISTEDLFAYVATMEDKFREVFETSSLCQNIVSSIFEMYKLHPFLNSYALCPCFPVEFFQKLFIRIRLYLTINYNNSFYRKMKANCFSIPGI